MTGAMKRAIAVCQRQYGAVLRRQLIQLGIPPATVDQMLRDGRLIKVYTGVYRLRDVPWSPHGLLMAACLATGGWASHESAAWLWGLTDQPPARPVVTVPRGARCARPGMTIHRTTRAGMHGRLLRIPCTHKVRTMVDLAGVVTDDQLDAALDRALGRRLCSVDDLAATVGLHGAGALKQTLRRRCFIGAPAPSVLESMVLRLLREAGIEPAAVEHRMTVDGHDYRIDVLITDGFGLEVDGFLYHHTPEARQHDHDRRNDLEVAGFRLLVYTWADVSRNGAKILKEVRDVLGQLQAAP